jgi:hypothetical protein
MVRSRWWKGSSTECAPNPNPSKTEVLIADIFTQGRREERRKEIKK